MMFGTEFAFQTKDSQRRFFQNMNVQEETSRDVQSLRIQLRPCGLKHWIPMLLLMIVIYIPIHMSFVKVI